MTRTCIPAGVRGGAVAVVLLTAACASASQGGAPGASSNVISREELQRVVAGNAYDAVAKLRPLWLSRPRAAGIPGLPLMVYVDRQPRGPAVEALREIPIENIVTMRFIRPVDARMAYNTDLANGVIEIITVQRR